MLLWSIMRDYAFAARELVNPTYRPERHYMRGPGPACAKRRQKTGELHGTMQF